MGVAGVSCPVTEAVRRRWRADVEWNGHVCLGYRVVERVEPGLVVTETLDEAANKRVVLHAVGSVWKGWDRLLQTLRFGFFERCPESPDGRCCFWVTGVSTEDRGWREVVEYLAAALGELRAMWPRVTAVWADLEAVCRRFWVGLLPPDEALVRAVRWEEVGAG